MSNCDNSVQFATITGDDFANAITYAKMRLLKEKTDALSKTNPNVQWTDDFSDKSVSYNCPSGLSGPCVQGYPRIVSKTECQTIGPYNPNDPKQGADPLQYYLEWREKEGNCYLGNWAFRNACSSLPQGGKTGHLRWDTDTRNCNMTRDFCDVNGFLDYEPGDRGAPGSGDGGTCQMTTSQDIASIFGNTFARGVVGGGCWK
jgi:hypothetical protein